ncbi:MAG TPA: alkaline phosphatase, partial [Bacteroidales bacterium]|nr:alkaline phosphatase [Bacteroidales bacterium]
MKLIHKFSVFFLLLTAGLGTFAQSGQADKFREEYKGEKAKYIFLFIGDGMGMAHVNATEGYLASKKNDISMNRLNMTGMEVHSYMTTYSKDRFITGSAASGTAIATGHKTTTGTISMDSKHKKKFKTIAERAKENGYKVGILTTVQINHATPAVFYAHQPVRHSYYKIGEQLAYSNFDYFAGGGFKYPEGRKNNQENLIKIAEKQGYKYVNNKRGFKKISTDDGKVITVNPRTDDGAMPYAIDMNRKDISLADFTEKGIEVLDNDEGFFMMVEGGKIDWAAHANDAAAVVHDVIDFDNAIEHAINFYNDHPDETLIIVTADHETGGMSVGSRSTKYSSFYNRLKYQELSLPAFADILKNKSKSASGLDFETALLLTKKHFNMGKNGDGFSLTTKDLKLMKAAFEIE